MALSRPGFTAGDGRLRGATGPPKITFLPANDPNQTEWNLRAKLSNLTLSRSGQRGLKVTKRSSFSDQRDLSRNARTKGG